MSEAADLDRARSLIAGALAKERPYVLPEKMPEDLRDAILAVHDIQAFRLVGNLAGRNGYRLCVVCLKSLTESDFLFKRACRQTGLSLCGVCFQAIYRQPIKDWELAQFRKSGVYRHR